ncbi:VOC family protein [Amycolatopsis sp. GM8]|uniref:VOC family protein n=1 Tax=Amycolatopsis sp. GM8 TaxID=2896530 RepID=UPI001F32FF79|nr:VOC family protein [Amycolatopsis sp. GM8]
MTEPSPLVEWLALTIDCPDPNALADFYATALGGEVYRRTGESAFVRTPGLAFVFRAVPNHRPTTWPSPEVPLHSHLELVVEDPDAAAQQMQRLGARMASHQDPDDPHYVVMLDPADHPFCLIRSSKARRP